MPPSAKKRDFFSAARNALMQAGLYYERLGIEAHMGYADFGWRDENKRAQFGRTVWSTLPAAVPAGCGVVGALLLNYMISDFDRTIKQFQQKGIEFEKFTEYEYGRYASFIDSGDQRIEVWEPRCEKDSLPCALK
jgi:hypothetical protein